MELLLMRILRKQNKWSLEYVAAYTGVSNQAISSIERGLTYPSYTVMCKLEKLFCCTHIELLSKHLVQSDDSAIV